MNEFYERINLKVDLSIISSKICLDYKLGKFKSNKVITVGYEDFTYILKTDLNTYCVKIFNKDRTDEECGNYIKRIEISNNLKINTPQLYKYNDKSLYKLTIENICFRLCVFEYIEGKSIFDLKIIPSKTEIKEIVRQISIIHELDMKLEPVYDSWTMTNYKKEYEYKKSFISEKDKVTLEDLYNKFDSIDFKKLTFTFIHGDITSPNLIIDKNNKIWIIDWAVSNYLPRIIDLAVSTCNICYDQNSKENTIKNIKFFLDEYQKYNKLTEYEISIFPLFFDLTNAIGILQTSYEMQMDNDSKENEIWLVESRKGLEFSTKDFWEQIF